MKGFIIVAFLLLQGHTMDANAEAVYVWGSGAVSCGTWLEGKTDTWLRYQRLQWLLGYISAYNVYTTSPQVRPIDAYGAAAFVDRYCSNKPLHMLTRAAALIEELGGPKAPLTWKR
jgi:hypothetical protein